MSFLTMTNKPSFHPPPLSLRWSRVQGERERQNWGAAVYMARWVSTRGEKGAVIGARDGEGRTVRTRQAKRRTR